MADAEASFPFPEGTFDCVVLSEVMEHVWPPDHVLEECFRVLKEGGEILVTVPFMYPIHGGVDYWRPTDQIMKRLFEDTGFDSLRIEKKYGRFCLLMTWLVTLPVIRDISGIHWLRRAVSKLDDFIEQDSWITGWNIQARKGIDDA